MVGYIYKQLGGRVPFEVKTKDSTESTTEWKLVRGTVQLAMVFEIARRGLELGWISA